MLPTIAQKAAFLATLPDVTQVIETHMAFVFLTSGHAFKLKKPLRFGYFDHRSLNAREKACSEELRLNRALARDIYLKKVALVLCQGDLLLDDPPSTRAQAGKPVDWLVKMRRLPQDRMLDAVIAAGQGPDLLDMVPVVAHLARFYRSQQQTSVRPGVYFSHLTNEQRINSFQLIRMAGHLPDPAMAQITHELSHRMERVRDDIAQRETMGQVVEGHGDLRPEHVCLTQPVIIFDRVETALEMRVIDVFDEVGYLAAECALMGRQDLGSALMQGLAAEGFVPPPPHLQSVYTMFRLVTRARLALMHLRDPMPRTPQKWPLRAAACLGEAIRMSRLTST